nr:retrovirus-related Pol polyprotein from transposon TNT 1-94 [Tanacetum cinerariifolium]
MQEKLNSLRSTTINLTEIQYTEINKMVEVPKGDTLLEEENQQLIVQQIIDELVAINNRLDNVKEDFRSKHDQIVLEDLYECTNHSSAPSSTLSDDEDLLQDISVEPTSSLTSTCKGPNNRKIYGDVFSNSVAEKVVQVCATLGYHIIHDKRYFKCFCELSFIMFTGAGENGTRLLGRQLLSRLPPMKEVEPKLWKKEINTAPNATKMATHMRAASSRSATRSGGQERNEKRSKVRLLVLEPVVIPTGESIPVKGKGDHTLPGGAKVKKGYRVPSYTRANYFLTIVDDFSKAVWVFLIKYKSEASKHLMGFHRMVEVHFEKQIKRIRCDNGEEFTSNNMLNFYNENGILLETTCPHTPQQNRSYGEEAQARARNYSSFKPNNDEFETNEPNEGAEAQGKTRPTRIRTQPSRFKDFVVQGPPWVKHPASTSNHVTSMVRYPISNFVSYDKFSSNHKAFLVAITNNDEPKSFKQAAQDARWREAMQKEVKALKKNDTWNLEYLPKGKQAIDLKWVYKIKFKPNGDVERYKARLFSKGFTQMEGVDYHDTFALVAKLVTVRTLLAIAVKRDWIIHKLDENNTLMHGDLYEEVCMKNLSRLDNETRVCRLSKSLYGLKQASRN